MVGEGEDGGGREDMRRGTTVVTYTYTHAYTYTYAYAEIYIYVYIIKEEKRGSAIVVCICLQSVSLVRTYLILARYYLQSKARVDLVSICITETQSRDLPLPHQRARDPSLRYVPV